ACGFRSYMSRWDGPPLRWIMITDLGFGRPGAGDSGRRRWTWPGASPPNARAPTRRTPRRVIPSQCLPDPGWEIVRMGSSWRRFDQGARPPHRHASNALQAAERIDDDRSNMYSTAPILARTPDRGAEVLSR